MPHQNLPVGPVRDVWTGDGPGRGDEPGHRCGKCWGPYGKSAIRCPNEPSTFDRLLADIQEHDYPEGQSNAEV